MKPASFSATALTVAEMCLARYKAEQIDRGRGLAVNTAASLGTAVHGALEMFVKAVHLEKSMPGDENLLLDLFKMSYAQTFGTSDYDTLDYLEGCEMLVKWYKRTDFTGITVLSCEVKENFPIKTSIGEIPFNYIWDRHDQIGDNEYKVVDYKTNRWGLNPADLKKKIQARAYGVAAQIKHPDAKRIWVEFDMLRHDSPVGIVFTRDDNIATWKFMRETAQRIIDTPDDDTPETLNPECNFCVRKISCSARSRNLSAGGIATLGSLDEMVDVRAELAWQKKAIEATIKELDEVILGQARAEDRFEFESDVNKMEIGVRTTRAVDAEFVEKVIGPTLFDRYGGKSITMSNVDKLLKGKDLTDEQKSQLRQLIYQKQGEPSVKVAPKNPIDED